MKIEEISPAIRFAERLEYTCARPLSKTYDSRLLYVTDGDGTITVGSHTARAERGLLVLFQGGVPYKFEPRPSFTAYAVDFDPIKGYPCDGFLLPVPASAFDERELHTRIFPENTSLLSEPTLTLTHAGIGEDIRRLVEEYNSPRPFAKKRAELMLAGLLLLLAGNLTNATKGAKCAEEVTAYIAEHYREPLTNEHIASVFGHDPCYLGRTVKLHTGTSIHRLLVKKRVEEGVKLLLASELGLEEIAERVGFCTAAHFSRRCKDVTGNNPSFYRKH